MLPENHILEIVPNPPNHEKVKIPKHSFIDLVHSILFAKSLRANTIFLSMENQAIIKFLLCGC